MSAPMHLAGWVSFGTKVVSYRTGEQEIIARCDTRDHARLIAAAPELLSAAENLLLTFDSYGKDRLPEYVRKEFAPLIAAVRKARGAQ